MTEKLIAVVKDLISHKHEEEWFEFKVNWYEPHELGVYISALSNVATLQGRENGYFVWGIENNTHRGLSEAHSIFIKMSGTNR